MDVATSTNAASFDSARDDIFSRIASRYDLLCDLFSLGIHRWWKRRMAQHILARPWQSVLDVAAGTGDISLRIADRLEPNTGRTCIVSDICPAMLDIAKQRGAARTNLEYMILDAHGMTEIADASVELFAISFAMKICDRQQVLAEAWRVLRPGGTFMCLEASEIPVRVIHQAYLTYMRLCMPLIGWIATGGDRSAYDYLLKGVCEFPGAAGFADEMVRRGFFDVGYERLSLGIVAIHWARKPER